MDFCLMVNWHNWKSSFKIWRNAQHILISTFFFFSPSPGNPFLNKEDKFIGSKYRKVVYREYTDHTFSTPKKRAEEQQHLEIQGIVITKFSLQRNKTRRCYLSNTEYSSAHTKWLNLHGIATFIKVLSMQDYIVCFTRKKKPFWFAARS